MVLDINDTSQKRLHRVARVWLDGTDVTHDCFYADDQAGVVRVNKRNTDGHCYIVGSEADPNGTAPGWPTRIYPTPQIEGYGEVAKAELRGNVRIDILCA